MFIIAPVMKYTCMVDPSYQPYNGAFCFVLIYNFSLFVTLSCFQRAWLLKLLTVELHSGDIKNSSHRETCHKILAYLFGQDTNGLEGDQDITSSLSLQNRESAGTRTINKSKVFSHGISSAC